MTDRDDWQTVHILIRSKYILSLNYNTTIRIRQELLLNVSHYKWWQQKGILQLMVTQWSNVGIQWVLANIYVRAWMSNQRLNDISFNNENGRITNNVYSNSWLKIIIKAFTKENTSWNN